MNLSQRMQIRFDTVMSSHFSISNGVKQGDVLNPILLTIYIDNLIMKLKKLNIGCRIVTILLGGRNYFGGHMSNNSKLDYVEQCVHLGTTLSSDISTRNINSE